MAPPSKLMSIRPWQYLTLSALMFVVSILTFPQLPIKKVANAPVFTTLRDPRSGLYVLDHRRVQVPRWFYVGLKGAPSALWCILIPLQHNKTIRRRWPWIHRVDGYIAALLSFELGVVGYYMTYRGWLTTHPDPLHLHSIYVLNFPPLIWPTFATGLAILGPFYYLSLFKMVLTARARKFEKHRQWAVLHSISGYTIAIERAIALGILAGGRVLHAMPDALKHRWLRLPSSRSDVCDAEVAAFALTVAGANLIAGFWACCQLSREELRKSSGGGSGPVDKDKVK